MEYAVIQTGGKQYKVNKNLILEVEKLEGTKGKIEFNNVLLYVNGDSRKIGTPLVDGLLVRAKILSQIRGVKIRVTKYRAKSKYRRVLGHRQELTRIQIEDIVEAGKTVKAKEVVKSSESKKVVKSTKSTKK